MRYARAISAISGDPEFPLPASAGEDLPVGTVIVTDQVARRRAPRECLHDLLRQPRRCRLPGHREPEQLSSTVAQHEKRKQALERQGWNHAEINRRDAVRMVAQECSPSLRWRPSAPDHVFGDRRLGDLEPELEQFAMDARGAPQWVLLAYPLDEFAQLTANPGPPWLAARFPAPIGPKPCSMPPQNRVRLNDAGQTEPDHGDCCRYRELGRYSTGKVRQLSPARFSFRPSCRSAWLRESLREVYQRKAEKLLLEELRKGNVQDLSQGQLVPLIPMAYKFFEAAKEGEYERNLRILAAFLRGELEQRSPDASNFARMVRRVEGLSLTDLKVMAMIDVSLSKTMPFLDEGTKGKRPFVSATMLSKSSQNKDGLTTIQIQEALVDLASRGFLIADGATRMSKSEEFYFVSSSFGDLMGRAREQVVSEGNGTETSG